MGSGEIPNELGDSWFSPKFFRGSLGIENLGGRALFGQGPVMGYRLQINSECQ